MKCVCSGLCVKFIGVCEVICQDKHLFYTNYSSIRNLLDSNAIITNQLKYNEQMLLSLFLRLNENKIKRLLLPFSCRFRKYARILMLSHYSMK